MIALQPFDVQFVVIVGSSTNVAAHENSFAILDSGHTSASGDAAALVDPIKLRIREVLGGGDGWSVRLFRLIQRFRKRVHAAR